GDAASVLHTGKSADFGGDLLEFHGVIIGLLVRFVLRLFVLLFEGKRGLLDFHGQKMFGAETGINFDEVLEAGEEKPSANERNERHGDFRDDQRVVSAALPTGAGTLGALFKRAGEIGAENPQRRNEPANNAGEQTDREGEKQNFRIKLRFV